MPSTTAAVTAFLPYLRRYARALTGSQETGDHCVRLCLETLLAEPRKLADDRFDRRVQLFAEFHAAWHQLGEEAARDASARNDGSRRQLKRCIAALPARERQVLLLSSLEGFTVAETGAILGLSEDEVVNLLNQAREHIWRQAAAEILIIEDDPIIAMNNVQIVEDLGHKVVGVAARKDQAVALAARTAPTLVLADIKLERGDDGIAAVKEILEKIRVPVIFVTGHPEMLLTGEAVEPAFVITKPFDPETLKTAIGHVLSLHGPRHLAAASF